MNLAAACAAWRGRSRRPGVGEGERLGTPTASGEPRARLAITFPRGGLGPRRTHRALHAQPSLLTSGCSMAPVVRLVRGPGQRQAARREAQWIVEHWGRAGPSSALHRRGLQAERGGRGHRHYDTCSSWLRPLGHVTPSDLRALFYTSGPRQAQVVMLNIAPVTWPPYFAARPGRCARAIVYATPIQRRRL